MWKLLRLLVDIVHFPNFLGIVQITSNNLLSYIRSTIGYGSDIPIAVGGVVSKIFVIFVAVTIGLNQGAQPILGFNYGAKKYNIRMLGCDQFTISNLNFINHFLGSIWSFSVTTHSNVRKRRSALLSGVRYARAFLFFTFINGGSKLWQQRSTAIGKKAEIRSDSITNTPIICTASSDASSFNII